MQSSQIDEFVLLLVLDQIQFQSVSLCLHQVIGLFQLIVHLFKLISSLLLFVINFAVVLVLVRHFLDLSLDLCQLGVLVFDVSLTFSHILLELGIKGYELILPLDHVLQTIRKELLQVVSLLGNRFCKVAKLAFPFFLNGGQLLVEDALQLLLLSVFLLVSKTFFLRFVLGRVVIVVGMR